MSQDQDKAASAGNLVYLQEGGLTENCFLQEVLYWIAFGRMPFSKMWSSGFDVREDLILGYKTIVPFPNGELEDEECERAGLPHDPRRETGWAWDVMLDATLEEIVVSRALVEEPELDESTRQELVRGEAEKLYKEIGEWTPKYEKVIGRAAAKAYLALCEGHLTSKGVLLPDPDRDVSLKILAEQGKKVGELDKVGISKDFWLPRDIYWEISAARNDSAHYCHIHCPTEEVMSVFPLDSVAPGRPIDGLVQHGSFFVLSSDAADASSSPPARRSKSRRQQGGRPREISWVDLHLEMAVLVPAGLPEKRDAMVAHLQGLCRERKLQVPSRRALYDFLAPYYVRYSNR